MRVFVTDGDNRAALAVTRSLGRAGHEVIVGERYAPALAHASRYCAERVTYPDPVSASDEFVDALAHLVRERRVDALLPVADITTFLITRNRVDFGSCTIPFADADVVERAANKVDLVRTALALGVPVPRTVVVPDPASVPDSGLEFPLVIKPRQSRVRVPGGWVSSSVSYAANREELSRDLSKRPDHHFPLMLQERIAGHGMGVFASYHDGRPYAWFAHRRVRERPPWGGVSVVSESIRLPEQARHYAQLLLDELGWRGVAMVEFKVDERDGLPKLMEINGRFWGSLQLAIDAGVDFPKLLLQAQDGNAAPHPRYRVGVRNRWFWGDVDSLLATLLGAGRPTGYAGPGRLRAVMSFMALWGQNLYYDNPKRDDVRPWLLETRQRFRASARVLASRKSDSRVRELARAARKPSK